MSRRNLSYRDAIVFCYRVWDNERGRWVARNGKSAWFSTRGLKTVMKALNNEGRFEPCKMKMMNVGPVDRSQLD